MMWVTEYGSNNCCDCMLLITSPDQIDITPHLQNGRRPMLKSTAMVTARSSSESATCFLVMLLNKSNAKWLPGLGSEIEGPGGAVGSTKAGHFTPPFHQAG
jgi:hypothetical protein